MTPSSPEDLETLVRAICRNSKYAQIIPSLVARVASEELEKRGDIRTAL